MDERLSYTKAGVIGRKAKKNGVLPFKAMLVDEDGNIVTDLMAAHRGALGWRASHTLRFLCSARENFWYQVDSAPPP
jgi:hypothetical protein